MQLTRRDLISGKKEIISNDYNESKFMDLMKRARRQWGLKVQGVENGFHWPNAHKMAFTGGGWEFKLEQFAEFDFFD